MAKKPYTKDFQLTKVRQKGGTSVMAWLPKSEAKKHRDDFSAGTSNPGASAPAVPIPVEYAKQIPTAPALTPPTTTAPISTTGLTLAPPMPIPPTMPQEQNPQTAIPGWWINQAIQNPSNPSQQFANAANALLPMLAPEDQRNLANYLATNFKDVYGGYSSVNFGQAPTEITEHIRKQYLSPQRAQTALSLLDRMKTASGATDMGTGYDFLRNAVALINQFLEPTGVLGREQYSPFANAVTGLTGQSGIDPAYANLAQLFNLPKFTAGSLVNNTPSNRLYT